jgi:hypothetical protein
MFRIRDEQLRALSSALESRADRALVGYALHRFPAEYEQSDDSILLEFVKNVRAAARQFGIEREDNVATFLDLTVMYGQNFPKASWAHDVLASQALHGPDKVALLRHRIQQTGVIL